MKKKKPPFFYSAGNKLTYLDNNEQISTRRSDGAPDVVRIKISQYRNLYLNRPDPIGFIPLPVDTTGRMYDEFIRLLFLHSHREGSALDNTLPEESDL